MARLRCARCNEVIGVYEPMVVISPEGRRSVGGQLTLRSELAEPGSVATHYECDHEGEDLKRTS